MAELAEPALTVPETDLFSVDRAGAPELFMRARERRINSYSRYNAVVGVTLQKAVARKYLTESEPAKEFMLKFAEANASAMEQLYDRSHRQAIGARIARSEYEISRAQTDLPYNENVISEDVIKISKNDVSPTETAMSMNLGADRAKARSPYTSYLVDQMAALEAAGWDFKAGKNAAENIIYNVAGTLPRAVDTARELIPFKYTIDWARFDFGILDMAAYQKMSVREQELVRQRVMGELQRKNATPFEAMHIMDMLDPTTSLAWEGGWAAVDTVGSILGIKSGVSTIRTRRALKQVDKLIELQQMRKAAGAAQKLGDSETAAAIVAKVLTGSDDVAKAANMTREEALLSVVPFDYRPLDPSTLVGLSDKAIAQIEKERKLQYYQIVRAFNDMNAPSAGFLRDAAERAAADQRILASLPNGAEIVDKNVFGVRVQVKFPHTSSFATEEDWLKAQKDLDVAIDEYNAASKALDDFESYPYVTDPPHEVRVLENAEEINKLQAQKDIAKRKMDELERILSTSKPARVEDRFIFYEYADDVGKFTGDVSVAPLESTGLVSKALSPDIWLERVDKLLVTERTSILAKQEQLQKLFMRAVRQVPARMKAGDMEDLYEVLMYGSDTQKVWDAKDLIHGIDIPNKGTVKLNPQQIAGYYKYRETMDQAHRLRSLMMFRELGGQGFRQTVLKMGKGTRKEFVKPVDASVLGRIKMLWDETALDPAKLVQLDDASRLRLSKRLEKGEYTLVEMKRGLRIDSKLEGAAERTDMLNYAVVRSDKITDLTPDVLPYRKGYVPNIYKDVPYVVRSKKPVYIDGDKTDIWVTERFFDRRDDATNWASLEQARTGRKYVADSDTTWRETDPGYVADIDEGVFTGLYQDKRGPLIPFGENAIAAPRHDPLNAMNRYMTNLAWAYPMNEARLAIVQRFMNSYGDRLANPNDWIAAKLVFKKGVSEAEKASIINVRNHVLDTVSITTQGERDFARSVKAAAEKLETISHGGVLDKVRLKTLYGVDQVDAFGLIRRAAYRTHMGFFNLSQLIVQAGNVAQILAANPQNAHRVVPRFLAVRAGALMNPAEPGWNGAMKALSKAAFMKESEFKDMMLAAHRSGYFYTVLTNADMAIAVRGIAPGGDLRNLGRFVDTVMQMPVLEGELASRIVGWLDAYTRLKRVNKWADVAADVDKINDVLSEALRVGYNYTQANRAWFQKNGPMSVITQFTQPMFKFYENVMLPFIPGVKMKGRFSRNERLRLLVAQPLLFGAAGMPFSPTFQELITRSWETLSGKDRSQFTKDEIVAISGGFTDAIASQLASEILGEDASPQISRRVSLANLEQFVTKFAPETSMLEFMLGPAAVYNQRAQRALEEIAALHMSSYKAGTLDMGDVLGVMDLAGTIVATSWNNTHKARMWSKAQYILSNKYGNIYKLDPEDPRGITTMKMFGFSSWEEQASYEMQDFLSKHSIEKEKRDVLNALDIATVHYMENGMLTGDPKELEKYMLLKDIIVGSLQTDDGRPEKEIQSEVLKAYSEKLLQPDNKVRQMLEKRWEEELKTLEADLPPATWMLIKPETILEK